MANPFSDAADKLKSFFRDFPDLAGNMAVRHFDRNWDLKGFMNRGVSIWKPVIDRKTGQPKQRPLVQTGNLRQGMDYERDGDDAIVYNDEPYAKYHNEGGTKEGRPPQRQFMGESEELLRDLEQMIEDRLDKIF